VALQDPPDQIRDQVGLLVQSEVACDIGALVEERVGLDVLLAGLVKD